MRGRRIITALAVLAAVATGGGTADASEVVKVGALGNTGDGPFLIGVERGYFKERGIEVKFEQFAGAAGAMAPLSKGELDVAGGGVNPALFNAFARGWPVKIVGPRAIDVSGNCVDALMIRTDLKGQIKRLADLKGRKVAINAPSSALLYMLGKMRESEGLTLKDVELVYMPWPDMAPAFSNRAIDAGGVVDPFVAQFEDKGHATVFKRASDVIKNPPFQVSVVFYNTEWAKRNPKLANDFMVAYLKSARDFHDAMYFGATRPWVVDILTKHTRVKERALYDRMHWGHTDPNGVISRESLRDQQEWYHKAGLVPKKVDVDEIVDDQYVKHAVQQLGQVTPKGP